MISVGSTCYENQSINQSCRSHCCNVQNKHDMGNERIHRSFFIFKTFYHRSATFPLHLAHCQKMVKFSTSVTRLTPCWTCQTAGTCSWSAMLVITTPYANLTRFLLSNVIVVSSSVARTNIASVGPCSLVFLLPVICRYVAMSEMSFIAVLSRSADSNGSA